MPYRVLRNSAGMPGFRCARQIALDDPGLDVNRLTQLPERGESMIEPVVVGLLGITHPHASARVRALREIEGVQVISAADDDPRLEYFTDKYGLDPVAVDALLADQRITAVLVHSKSVDMVPLALRALEAGKSVLVEKPGGGALADLTRLAAAARAPGAIVQVGYNVRFAESVTRARLLLDRGLIGDVVSVSARGAPLVGEHLTQHLNQPADMGGALWIIGCHMLDVLLSFFGPPTSVNARVRKYERLSGTGSREDAAAVILTYPERQVVFDFDVYDRLEWFEGSRITFHGTGGLMEIGILPMSLRVYLPEARNEWSQGWTQWMSSQFTTPFAQTEDNRFSELPELANIDFFRSEMTKFVDSIRTGADVAVPASAALDVALVVDACYRSEQFQGANTALAVPGVASPPG
jgi:predicted dehydrogenase